MFCKVIYVLSLYFSSVESSVKSLKYELLKKKNKKIKIKIKIKNQG